MKIGVNRWTMPSAWTLAECFKAARTAGFDSVEVNVDAEGELTLNTSETTVKAIAESARECGIEISSLSNSLGWSNPLTAPEESGRQKAKEVIRGMLRIGMWLGVDTLLCVPGRVEPDVSYDAAYERAQTALKDLAKDAAQAGVRIGVENVWNKFLLSPIEMKRFVDEIGDPWIGVYFDAGNVLVTGYPQHWIRILGERILRLHVKEFKAQIGNITAFCNPLQGDVPWTEVRKALDAIGYNGFITAEVDGYPAYPELGLRHIHESLRLVFG